MPDRWSSYVVRAARFVRAHLVLAWVIAQFLLRTPLRYYGTVRRGRRLLRALRREGLSPSPLRERAPHAFEVDVDWVRAQAGGSHTASPQPDSGVVLHFTGTGETRHGPLVALARALPELAQWRGMRHYIIDAPEAAAAYRSALSFGGHLWQAVEPIVDAHPGPYLCIGLSRGGLAALEMGMRIAGECGKLAMSVACSPPLTRPRRLPPTVALIGALQPAAEAAAEIYRRAPRSLRGRVRQVFCREIQTLLTCFVLAELQLDDEENLQWAMRDVLELDNVATSLRLTREFGLLARGSQAELSHFVGEVHEAMRHTPRFSALWCWGERDTWTSASDNWGLLRDLQSKDAPSPEPPHAACLLPGPGHALCRQRGDHQPAWVALLQDAVGQLDEMTKTAAGRAHRRHDWQDALREARLAGAHPASEELDDV